MTKSRPRETGRSITRIYRERETEKRTIGNPPIKLKPLSGRSHPSSSRVRAPCFIEFQLPSTRSISRRAQSSASVSALKSPPLSDNFSRTPPINRKTAAPAAQFFKRRSPAVVLIIIKRLTRLCLQLTLRLFVCRSNDSAPQMKRKHSNNKTWKMAGRAPLSLARGKNAHQDFLRKAIASIWKRPCTISSFKRLSVSDLYAD